MCCSHESKNLNLELVSHLMWHKSQPYNRRSDSGYDLSPWTEWSKKKGGGDKDKESMCEGKKGYKQLMPICVRSILTIDLDHHILLLTSAPYRH